MELQVSTEVEPGVFDEAAVAAVGGRILARTHLGWLSIQLDPERLGDLRRVQGVLGALTVTACDDRLERLPAALAWTTLAEADAYKLVALRLEAGRAEGRIVALRLTAAARQICFVRCHLTSGIDMVVFRPDAAEPSGRRVLARHSDGLRDHSKAGMHDWAAGSTRSIVMWVAHLPPGEAAVEAGFIGGWIRVDGKPRPFTFTTPVALG